MWSLVFKCRSLVANPRSLNPHPPKAWGSYPPDPLGLRPPTKARPCAPALNREKPRTPSNPPFSLGDFGALWELGFEVLELGFEDLGLGFHNSGLGFEDGGLGFEVLREERGVLSSEAGWLEGVRAPGARFACLRGCSRTLGGVTGVAALCPAVNSFGW